MTDPQGGCMEGAQTLKMGISRTSLNQIRHASEDMGSQSLWVPVLIGDSLLTHILPPRQESQTCDIHKRLYSRIESMPNFLKPNL